MKLSDKQSREVQTRRKQFARLVGRNGAAIVPAAHEVVRARDTHYRFRQNSDFQYLTGFPEPEAIMVLIPGRKEGEYVLFVRPRDVEREIWDGRREGPEGAVANYGADEAYNLDQLGAVLPRLLAGRDTLHYTLGEFPELDARIAAHLRLLREISRRGAAAPTTMVSLDVTLHEMRLFKSRAEVALMKQAAEVSARAHVRAMRSTRPGRNEWQVASEIHAEFELAGLQPGYGSIVGGGDNACILHYTENNQTLRDGDLLLIDAGGEFEGYTADITRTFPVNGRFSPAQKALYEVVLKANLAAIKELRPGNSVGKPHELATRILTQGLVDLGLLKGQVEQLIEEGKHRQFYMHGTGHWLGMDVHDVGRYKLDGKFRKFEPGMIMTVEPGLYIAPNTPNVPKEFLGMGIRVEDDVLVTDSGPLVLTSGVPKDVADIEALMAA
jgi:Xaa-Pro aminopeptidase